MLNELFCSRDFRVLAVVGWVSSPLLYLFWTSCLLPKVPCSPKGIKNHVNSDRYTAYDLNLMALKYMVK